MLEVRENVTCVGYLMITISKPRSINDFDQLQVGDYLKG